MKNEIVKKIQIEKLIDKKHKTCLNKTLQFFNDNQNNEIGPL